MRSRFYAAAAVRLHTEIHQAKLRISFVLLPYWSGRDTTLARQVLFFFFFFFLAEIVFGTYDQGMAHAW